MKIIKKIEIYFKSGARLEFEQVEGETYENMIQGVNKGNSFTIYGKNATFLINFKNIDFIRIEK